MNALNHPKGLWVLCLTEMWERFSYYGMRALLMLYMVQALGLSAERAGTIYGLYTGLVYLTPIAGGYLADRYLGQRHAIVAGGGLMALGHFGLIFPPPYFWLSLGLIILGNGLFKPNIAVLVGRLYRDGDARRDAGFTIFYVGINLGAFLAPFVCGTLGQRVGWHVGFSAAGFGMLLGIAALLFGRRHLGDLGRAPSRALAGRPERGSPGDLAATLTPAERSGLMALGLLAVFGNVVWWSAFEQAGSSLTLFAETAVDLTVNTRAAIPSSWFQAANPFFIACLAPLFSWVWICLARAGREPHAGIKFIFALVFLAIGFGLLVIAGGRADAGTKVSMIWLLAAYFFNTCGELCISPVGLSAVSRLAPARFASLAMGLWYASLALANFMGGQFSGRYVEFTHHTFFLIPVMLALVSALVLTLLSGRLGRLMARAADPARES